MKPKFLGDFQFKKLLRSKPGVKDISQYIHDTSWKDPRAPNRSCLPKKKKEMYILYFHFKSLKQHLVRLFNLPAYSWDDEPQDFNSKVCSCLVLQLTRFRASPEILKEQTKYTS